MGNLFSHPSPGPPPPTPPPTPPPLNYPLAPAQYVQTTPRAVTFQTSGTGLWMNLMVAQTQVCEALWKFQSPVAFYATPTDPYTALENDLKTFVTGLDAGNGYYGYNVQYGLTPLALLVGNPTSWNTTAPSQVLAFVSQFPQVTGVTVQPGCNPATTSTMSGSGSGSSPMLAFPFSLVMVFISATYSGSPVQFLWAGYF